MRKAQTKRTTARRLKRARGALRATAAALVAALRGMAQAAAPRPPRPVPVPVPAYPRFTRRGRRAG